MDTMSSSAEAPRPEIEAERKRTRRQWTEVEARSVLAALRASGEPITHFAKKSGVSPSQIHRWMNGLGERAKKGARRRPAPRSRFVRVRVQAPERPPEEPVPVRAARMSLAVEVNGRLVHVERGFDPDLLRAVVAALEAQEVRSC
jgi:hypothetical protein